MKLGLIIDVALTVLLLGCDQVAASTFRAGHIHHDSEGAIIERSEMKMGQVRFTKKSAWGSSTCEIHSEGKNVVALGKEYMPMACGRCVLIKDGDGGNEKAIVAGSCDDCGPNDVEANEAMLGGLSKNMQETLSVNWAFVEC